MDHAHIDTPVMQARDTVMRQLSSESRQIALFQRGRSWLAGAEGSNQNPLPYLLATPTGRFSTRETAQALYGPEAVPAASDVFLAVAAYQQLADENLGARPLTGSDVESILIRAKERAGSQARSSAASPASRRMLRMLWASICARILAMPLT